MALQLDTNMYPTGYGQQQAPQQPASPGGNSVTTPMGGVGNMVQALMGGYNKYLSRPQEQGQPQGMPADGAPLQIHPDMGASLGNGGMDPNGNMVQALFNPSQLSGLY